MPNKKEYVELGELAPGTLLQTADQQQATIVAMNTREGKFDVYNIEVEGPHNYFVSDQKVLVHNKAMWSDVAKSLPDFTGKSLRDVMKTLESAGFKKIPRKAGSKSPYRVFKHPDGSMVHIDTANKHVKVLGPKQWASDGSRKYHPRYGPHNQTYK